MELLSLFGRTRSPSVAGDAIFAGRAEAFSRAESVSLPPTTLHAKVWRGTTLGWTPSIATLDVQARKIFLADVSKSVASSGDVTTKHASAVSERTRILDLRALRECSPYPRSSASGASDGGDESGAGKALPVDDATTAAREGEGSSLQLVFQADTQLRSLFDAPAEELLHFGTVTQAQHWRRAIVITAFRLNLFACSLAAASIASGVSAESGLDTQRIRAREHANAAAHISAVLGDSVGAGTSTHSHPGDSDEYARLHPWLHYYHCTCDKPPTACAWTACERLRLEHLRCTPTHADVDETHGNAHADESSAGVALLGDSPPLLRRAFMLMFVDAAVALHDLSLGVYAPHSAERAPTFPFDRIMMLAEQRWRAIWVARHKHCAEPTLLAHVRARSPQSLRIWCGTWNVGGQQPNLAVDLRRWLGTAPTETPGLDPDMYVIGFQEAVPLNTTNVVLSDDEILARREHWKHSLLTALNTLPRQPGGHDEIEFLCSAHQVGVLLFVFGRKKLTTNGAVCIRGIRMARASTGFSGLLGNKGAVAISLQIDHGDAGRDTSAIAFVCAHFTAHAGAGPAAQRARDYQDIVRALSFGKVPDDVAPHARAACIERAERQYFAAASASTASSTTGTTEPECEQRVFLRHNDPLALYPLHREHDAVIWLGDLNYRLVLGHDTMVTASSDRAVGRASARSLPPPPPAGLGLRPSPKAPPPRRPTVCLRDEEEVRHILHRAAISSMAHPARATSDAQRDLDTLLRADELQREMSQPLPRRQAFVGYAEPAVRFAPTYKLKASKRDVAPLCSPHSFTIDQHPPASERSSHDTEAGRLGLSDAYSAKRLPAWTDRILWRSVSGDATDGKLPCLRHADGTYCSVPKLKLSDHRPVCATFDFEL